MSQPLEAAPNVVQTVAKPQDGRVPFLDGVRGYTALFVVLSHTCDFARYHLPILSGAAYAVDIFMIVSGFLMTQHYLGRAQREPWDQPRTWMLFYLRRFFRIAPLYYCILIPCFVLFPYLNAAFTALQKGALGTVYDPTIRTMGPAMVLTHITFLFGLLPHYAASLATPDWSIGLEMQFYAAFPFLMLLARRFHPVRLTLVAVPVWLLFAKYTGVYVTAKPKLLGFFPQPSFLPLKIGLFLVGILLAWAWTESRGTLTPRTSLYVALAIAICRPTSSPVTLTVGLMTLMLFYDEDRLGLGLGAPVEKLRRFLGNDLARFLARVSYGVYLVHMLILIPLVTKLEQHPGYVHRAARLHFVLLLALVLPTTYGLAWLLSRFVEEPGLRTGKALITVLANRKVDHDFAGRLSVQT